MDFNLIQFEKHSDERGDLVVFLKSSDLMGEKKKFGQIYFVTFSQKGVIRGNHYHKKWREWFGIVTGKLRVLLKDRKTQEIKELILEAGQNKYIRLEIGPNIVHAFESLSDSASLINYTDTEWSDDDTFKEVIL